MTTGLTPAQLERGHFYVTHVDDSPWEIVSVGPKWITFREWYRDYGTGPMRAHPIRRLSRRGWEAAAFREVERP